MIEYVVWSELMFSPGIQILMNSEEAGILYKPNFK